MYIANSNQRKIDKQTPFFDEQMIFIDKYSIDNNKTNYSVSISLKIYSPACRIHSLKSGFF